MKTLNYCWAVNEAIAEEMARDDTVFIAGEDVAKAGGPFGATRGLLDAFGPVRVKDTPISENTIIGLAVGAAQTGLRPVVEIIFIDFFGLCLDQINNQAAKMHYIFAGAFKMPLVIRTLVGAECNIGPHHSQSLEAWACHIPGVKVIMPTTPYDVKGLLKSAVRDDNPVICIEHLALYRTKGQVPASDYTLPIGVADIKRAGTDITIVATGLMVPKALRAAEVLAQEGIDAEVIDPRTLSPLDSDTIFGSVAKTGRVMVVTGSLQPFGIGAEMIARIVEQDPTILKKQPRRITPPFTPCPFGTHFEQFLYPQEDGIVTAAREMLA